MRSAIRTVEKRCEMSTAIRPLVSSANLRNTSYSARASSDAVGSSRIRTWASRDRKSTRLNSSHDQISYAVFCLKKKNADFPDLLLGSYPYFDNPVYSI